MAASAGTDSRLRWVSSPICSSRRTSIPTRKKKNTIRPSLTQYRSDSVTPAGPKRTENSVSQNRSYDSPHGELAHSRASTVAITSSAALAASVAMNRRTGADSWAIRCLELDRVVVRADVTEPSYPADVTTVVGRHPGSPRVLLAQRTT